MANTNQRRSHQGFASLDSISAAALPRRWSALWPRLPARVNRLAEPAVAFYNGREASAAGDALGRSRIQGTRSGANWRR